VVEAGRKRKEQKEESPRLKRSSHSMDHLRCTSYSDHTLAPEMKKRVRLTFLKEREPRIKLLADKPPRGGESKRQKSPKKVIKIVKIKKKREDSL